MKNKTILSHHEDNMFIMPNTTGISPWEYNELFYQTDPTLNIQLATNVLTEPISDFDKDD